VVNDAEPHGLAVLDQLDAVVREDLTITLIALKTPPLGEERQATSPVEQLQGETGNRLAPAQHDDRATPSLVTVASRAMEHADAVMVEEADHVGKLVNHASGEDHAQGDELLVAHTDDEATLVVAPRRRRLAVTEHDGGIAAYLRSRRGKQRHGIGRVAAKIAMGLLHPPVAVLAAVDHEHRTAVTRQPSRRAQTGGASSHYDDVVDWTKVKASGRDFAIAKATEGDTFDDPQFATNWAAMKQAGVVRSAYHFFHSTDDPIVQADHLLSVMGPLEPGDLPPSLDLEVTEVLP